MAIRRFSTSSIKSGTKSSKFWDQITYETVTADFLVLAGGGGTPYRSAGQYYSGGGGAGGLRSSVSPTGGGASAESSLTLQKRTTYTVSVGAGGTGADTTNAAAVTNGVNSSISGTGITTITSLGGGKSAYADTNGTTGGCGGGAAGNDTARTGGSGTTGQGYAGGNTPANNNGGPGAGGGGTASAGTNPTGNNGTAGNGGNAVSNNITGSSVYYGAGGAGMRGYYGNIDGASGTGYSYTSNTGCGGEGQSNGARTAGCSGVVIIRATQAASATTGSPTYTTSGSYHIYKFTGDGSITY